MKQHHFVSATLFSALLVMGVGCGDWKHEPGMRYPASATMDQSYDDSHWRVEGSTSNDSQTQPPPAQDK